MSATVRQVVDDALAFIGEVAGVGVQQYEDDLMKRTAIRGFNTLFKKYYWRQFVQWFRVELDGTTGIIKTDSFEQVLDFEDFFAVSPDAQDYVLPMMPKDRNPFSQNLVSGSRVRYWTSLHSTNTKFKKRKLQFYPVTATGFVNIGTRLYPLVPPALDWDWQDTMELDRDMLAYATAFISLIGNDLNPNAANIAKEMMEMRYRDVLANIASRPVMVEGYTGIPTNWFVDGGFPTP